MLRELTAANTTTRSVSVKFHREKKNGVGALRPSRDYNSAAYHHRQLFVPHQGHVKRKTATNRFSIASDAQYCVSIRMQVSNIASSGATKQMSLEAMKANRGACQFGFGKTKDTVRQETNHGIFELLSFDSLSSLV